MDSTSPTRSPNFDRTNSPGPSTSSVVHPPRLTFSPVISPNLGRIAEEPSTSQYPPGGELYHGGDYLDASQPYLSRRDRVEEGDSAHAYAPSRTFHRCSLNHFDPPGVNKLRKTLSYISQHSAQQPSGTEQEVEGSEASEGSQVTLGVVGEHFDFEKSLREYFKKRDEAGIKSRELGVGFEDLRVIGLGAGASHQTTLGTMFNPLNIAGAIRNMRHPILRDILSGFEGVVRPGEMLLVLGRPGSGSSTLLKVLANQREDYHGVEGNVYYDSMTPEEIEKHYRGDAQYCPEDDRHFPTLTVRQTLLFAAKTRAPHPRIMGQTRSAFVHFITDIIMTIFGLMRVSTVRVGNEFLRGVSGGEGKRVSIGEAIASRGLLHSWDNSTRGLDSSTALEYVRALRISTDIIRHTTIVAIYQAGEQLYRMFDKVCLIYEGRMIYFGPADQARQYFIDMGYEPANRQTTADFLVAVTDPFGRKARGDYDPSVRGSLPQSPAEFENYYRDSDLGKWNREDLDAYKRDYIREDRALAYKESAAAEHARHTRNKSSYTISIPMQVRIVMLRRAQILRGNWTTEVLQIAVFIIQGIIIGTVFVNLPETTAAYFSRGGVLFFAVFVPALINMSEIPALFASRPIVHRHQRAAMYHPMAEAIAMTIVDLPLTFTTMTLYSIILYFIVDLQRTAGQFFIFLLFVVTVSVSMRAFFRTVAAIFKSEPPAQAVAGVLILALSLYTGYQIPRPTMIGALRWISTINPLRYAFEALIVNEFHTLNGLCSSLVPSGPGYETVSLANQVCSVVGALPGQNRVDGNRFVNLSFGYSFSNLWKDYGILCAFGGGFIVLLAIFTEFNTKVAGETPVVKFKPDSRAPILKVAENKSNGDEEKAQTEPETIAQAQVAEAEAKEAMSDQPQISHVFSWEHLNYTVRVDGEERKLLQDVFGYVAPGKLTALMGASGAGKAGNNPSSRTTLLNVLAERVDTGVVVGERFIDGHPLPLDFQAQTGYCQQMDTHVPTQTVREALVFSARLRQPQSVPVSEKDAYADKCLRMCGLENFADAIVYSLGTELRKRLTIAVELAAKPRLLLFLDEPTSGLDSLSAWSIVSFLRDLADSGQAILCTIHQPSAELLQVFDRLLLLERGGRMVFFGDIGHNATELIDYFEEGGARKCQPDENPAEYMLDVIGAGATATTDRDWHQVWLDSAKFRQEYDILERIHAEGRKRPPLGPGFKGSFATPWPVQTVALVLRQHQFYWRDPTYLMAKLMLNIVGGLFIGFTFFKSKHSLQGTQNQIFAIFMSTILSVPLSNQIVGPFISIRNIYQVRERPSRIYHWSALLTAQILVEVPWNVIGATLYFFCWFWTVGFPSSRAPFTYLLYGLLYPVYFSTFAMAVASMSPVPVIANLLASFLFTFVITFNGVLQPFQLLGWWKWMYHVSPYTYLIGGLVGQAVGHQPIQCAPKEFNTVEPPSGTTCGSFLGPFISRQGGSVANPGSTSGCLFCSSATTDQFIGPKFNIFYSQHWRNLGIFCAYIVINIGAIYLLTYLFRIRSPLRLLLDLKDKFVHRKRSAGKSSSPNPEKLET
ncbi:pleiotropic drug resistance ABC transporter [Amanita muscaria]